MYIIYIISSEINEKKIYKIGYTKRDIDKRVKEFKIGNASNFEVVDTFKTKWGPKVEANIKRRFKLFNVNGEWFDLPIDEVNNFNSYCRLAHNNFELLSKNNTWVIENNIL